VLAITVLVEKTARLQVDRRIAPRIDGKESLEPFHPVLMVIQTFGEPAIPSATAAFRARSARWRSAIVLLTEGLLDPSPPRRSEALGAAALFDIGGAAAHQSDAFKSLGLQVDSAAAHGRAGERTLLHSQDGHFAIFDDRRALPRRGISLNGPWRDARVDPAALKAQRRCGRGGRSSASSCICPTVASSSRMRTSCLASCG